MALIFRLITIGSLLATSAASASHIEFWGRTYDYSCGYFSRRASDFSVTFHVDNDQLPFGSKVNLIYGFNGAVSGPLGPNSDWIDRTVITAAAVSDGTWEAKILDKTMTNRGSSKYLTRVQFIIEAIAPGSQPVYFNGGSPWGYFESEKLDLGVDCVGGGVIPSWQQLPFHVVSKL